MGSNFELLGVESRDFSHGGLTVCYLLHGNTPRNSFFSYTFELEVSGV